MQAALRFWGVRNSSLGVEAGGPPEFANCYQGRGGIGMELRVCQGAHILSCTEFVRSLPRISATVDRVGHGIFIVQKLNQFDAQRSKLRIL